MLINQLMNVIQTKHALSQLNSFLYAVPNIDFDYLPNSSFFICSSVN